MTSSTATVAPARIAIIGAGPRGLWAAEELLATARERGAAVDVTVLSDRPGGAAGAYQEDLPEWFLLNAPSRIVHTHTMSFDQWRLRHGETEPLDPFPPRRLVGAFHQQQWQQLQQAVPPGSAVRVISGRVTDLIPGAAAQVKLCWRALEQPAGEQARELLVDQVLLTGAHADSWPGALRPEQLPAGARLAGGVYQPGTAERVEAGTAVVVRGAALSFIDAALLLTAARGGRFVYPEKSGCGPDTAAVPTYVPSGMEPAAIIPVTRSGRFMEVKPCPTSALGKLEFGDIIDDYSPQLAAATTVPDMVEVLAACALELLRRAGRDEAAVAAAAPEVDAVLAGTDFSGDPVAELAASHAVATGAAPASPAWAVGTAWRELYPVLISLTSFGGRQRFPGFGDLAHRMERVGFGPPPLNAGRILALLQAGMINASYLGRAAEFFNGTAQLRGSTGSEVSVIDAVIAPPGVVPGTLAHHLVSARGAQRDPLTGALITDRSGAVAGMEHVFAVGRTTEGWVLGNDSLNRGLHDIVPRWARRTVSQYCAVPEDELGVHGTPPVAARLEPWARQLVADGRLCEEIVQRHGSPTNVLHPGELVRNARELIQAGEAFGVPVRIFFARKANKALAFVDAARDAGLGVDVASYRELTQVLEAGVPGDRIICSAAIKTDELLEAAVAAGVTISVDSVPELHRIRQVVRQQPGACAAIAPRVAPDPALLPPTRFGERAAVWREALAQPSDGVQVVGVHAHLHGYAATARATALAEACTLIDALAAAGHRVRFVDLGGGVPMSYVEDERHWENYRQMQAQQAQGLIRPFTWKADPLANHYPYYQRPIRGQWLQELLQLPLPGPRQKGQTAAQALLSRGLRLHLEPGRSLLDGCGMTLMRVSFVKTMSDGTPVVGVEANRTQVRTTSDDYVVDPILVRRTPASDEEVEGFVVGAYCIEDEVILRRRMRFPRGVAAGDILAIPNTAGYFMHILESASHQIPLAANVVLAGATTVRDRIDNYSPNRPEGITLKD